MVFRKCFSAHCLPCLFIALANPCHAEAPNFQGLGDLSGGRVRSYAHGVSGDGSVVVGKGEIWAQQANETSYEVRYEAFRWTAADGMVGLGFIDIPAEGISLSEAFDVSADGSTVVGESTSQNGTQPFRWTEADGMVGLGRLSEIPFPSAAHAVSADGSVVAGVSGSGTGPRPISEAFRWTEEVGMVGLGFLSNEDNAWSQAFGVSADGSVVVGSSSVFSDLPGERKAFRWTAEGGIVELAPNDYPEGFPIIEYEAFGVSADGSTSVGTDLRGGAVLWTPNGEVVSLRIAPPRPDLPAFESGGAIRAASADGSVLVGTARAGLADRSISGLEAFVSDSSHITRNLQAMLTDDFGLDLTGWTLKDAWDISDDGKVIVGWGINPAGDDEAWRAVIPEPSSFLMALAAGLCSAFFRRSCRTRIERI